MSDQKIVNGYASSNSYVVVAFTKTCSLAVRPLVAVREAVNRAGNPVGGKKGINLWFRVHLQDADRDTGGGMPSKRVAKNWGFPLTEKSEARYWRNDVFLQVAYVGECTNKYLREKAHQGLNTMLDQMEERIINSVWIADRDETVAWLESRLEPQLENYGTEGVKNTPALLSNITLGFDTEE